ncbi:MAG TPA: ATP-binding protein [Gammaproteobacteria bacterium]|nr:ATP-binding protein [Gammaproteobacteria bacterium]
MPRLRSLNVLVMAGFTLVALPLIAAIIITSTFVNRLTEQSERVVASSAYAARSAQMISAQVVALERNARQYRVLGDPALLKLYEERHAQLMGLIEQLRAVTMNDEVLEARLNRLNTEARGMLARLRAPLPNTAPDAVPNTQQDNPTSTQSPANDSTQTTVMTLSSVSENNPPDLNFDAMNRLATDVIEAVNAWIDQQLQALRINAREIDQLLFWQAATVIPLVALVAVVFTFLINRPVRDLGRGIRQLGQHGFQHPIRISGPLDLAALGQQLDWLRRRLAELEQEKNRFLSNMSHELKTPLGNLREGAELLADGSVGKISAAQREVIEILQDNTVALQKSIEGLLQFNTWRERRARLKLEVCNIHQIVNNTLSNHRLRLASEKLKVELKLKVKYVTADAEQLAIMLDNLLSNAIKYSPGESTIYIHSTSDNDGWIRLDVADEGPGIAIEDRERVFEAFYQGSRPGSGHLHGTGIGLAVVKESAQAHGGDVLLLDNSFPGAHFCIYLPDGKPPGRKLSREQKADEI